MLKRLAVLNQAAVVLGCATQLLRLARYGPLTRRAAAESLLSWSLPLNLGVLESLWFVDHLRRIRAAESAGEPPVDPLRSELAFAHLAFGILGLLAVRFRGLFWFATILGQVVFLCGVVAVNGRQILKDKMYLFDLLMSLAHLGLLMVYGPPEDARPPRRRWSGRRG